MVSAGGRAALAVLALSLAAPASAATFEAERLTDGRVALHMHGVIKRGDEAKLAAAMHRTPAPVLLLLEGPGGDLWSSVEIGRLNVLPTQVRTGEECSSGCAIVWASARERYVETGASIGFHQPVDTHGHTSTWANDQVAAYYGRLGFKPEAIRRMTYAPPTSMHWIDDTDAANGIAFAPRPTTRGTPIATRAETVQPVEGALSIPAPARVGGHAITND